MTSFSPTLGSLLAGDVPRETPQWSTSSVHELLPRIEETFASPFHVQEPRAPGARARHLRLRPRDGAELSPPLISYPPTRLTVPKPAPIIGSRRKPVPRLLRYRQDDPVQTREEIRLTT